MIGLAGGPHPEAIPPAPIPYLNEVQDTSQSPTSDRLLIIGWDGADWDILDELLKRDLMPNLARMLLEGARGVLRSTIPSHSWAAWSTFLTGVNPGRHGVFDFVERDPREPLRRIPISSSSLRAQTFFESLSEGHYAVRVGNVPVTFPPFPIRGRMIAGVAIPPRTNITFPPNWSKELDHKAPLPTNGMEWARNEGTPHALVEETRRFIEARARSFEVMLEGDWSVATCVFLAPDRLQHPFGAYLFPTHPDYASLVESELGLAIRTVYSLLDEELGRLRRVAGTTATTVLMSDHGFRPINRVVHMNRLLRELGLQSAAKSAEVTPGLRASGLARIVGGTRVGRVLKRKLRAPSAIDWSSSAVYQSGTGFGVSVNLKGREPRGIVPAKAYDETRERVRDALLGFVDPVTSSAPVKEVFLREELYEGPYLELAPDLIVEWNAMWSFSPEQADQLTADTRWPTGEHRREGILVSSGGRTAPGDLGVREIADIAATALTFCGLSSAGLDGVPIEAISGPALAQRGQPDERPSPDRSPTQLSDEDQEHIASHLRNLGYIE